MTVKELKRIVASIPDHYDDKDVLVKSHSNPCGNCDHLESIELDSYGFFGKSIPCVMLSCEE